MTVKYVQFSDSKKTKVVSEFDSPQEKDTYKYQGEIDSEDSRYIEFIEKFPLFLQPK